MMRKIVLLAAVSAMLVTNASADGLIIPDITIPLGGQAELDIQMENETELTAFQFDIQMAEGISVAESDNGRLIYSMGERFSNDAQDFTLSMSNPEEGVYRALGYHTVTCPISGNSGTIVNVTLEASQELTVGQTYYCTVSDIILTEPSAQKHYPEDITFAVTIGEPDDGRIKFNETSASLPNYTAGEKGDVRMTRTIKSGVWNTIVLPFTLTKTKAEKIFGSDVELATFSGFETEYTDDDDITPDAIVINFTEYKMTARKGMTGGTPYLIRIHKDEDMESFEADDVTLTKTVTPTTGSDEWETQGKFTGSLVKTVVPADGLFVSDNKFWYSTGKTNIKAFRGWFELDAVLDKETDFGTKIRFSIDGEPTYIEGLSTTQHVEGVYSLQGLYLGNDVDLSKLQKGIYIVNGKKISIK